MLVFLNKKDGLGAGEPSFLKRFFEHYLYRAFGRLHFMRYTRRHIEFSERSSYAFAGRGKYFQARFSRRYNTQAL